MAAVLSPPQSTHAGCHAQAKAGSERIAEALAKRVEQLEAVRIVTAEITQELDLTTLLRLITQRAVELVEPAASGVIYLWDEAEQVLVPRAWHGYGEWLRDIRIRLGESIAGTIAQSRAGLLVNDYQTSPYAHSVIIADFRDRKLPHNGQGHGYSKTTGRLCNHGTGGHPLSRAASRRMGLCARLSKRTTTRSACTSSRPPVSTNLR